MTATRSAVDCLRRSAQQRALFTVIGGRVRSRFSFNNLVALSISTRASVSHNVLESPLSTVPKFAQNVAQSTITQPEASARVAQSSNKNKRHARNAKVAEHEVSAEEGNLTTSQLYQKLEGAVARNAVADINRLARYLVTERREKPNAKLYSALILANVDSKTGSAAAVASLLDDLREERVELDVRLCHNILEVLAIHPDYLLRQEIIQHMRERWFTLTGDAHHFIIAGLLREGQLELALHMIEEMRSQSMFVHGWLYDMLGFILAEAGEIDEAFRVIKFRMSLDDTAGIISPMMWYHLLDHASCDFHHRVTVYVWKKRVVPSYLNPPDGMCFNILNTAARHGDTELATDVFRILSNRNFIFDIHHYEMLIDTYLTAGDLSSSFSVLSVMHSAGVNPEDESIRPIVTAMRELGSSVDKTFDSLRSLKGHGRPVPTKAVNCVIEVALEQHGLEKGLDTYKELHTVCDDGPDVSTFNLLLRRCRQDLDKETAMFLVSEMVALKITPNVLTYERLVELCLLTKSPDDAMGYYLEMTSQGLNPRAGTLKMLVNDCVKRKDSAVWKLVNEMPKDKTFKSLQNQLKDAAKDVPGYEKWSSDFDKSE